MIYITNGEVYKASGVKEYANGDLRISMYYGPKASIKSPQIEQGTAEVPEESTSFDEDSEIEPSNHKGFTTISIDDLDPTEREKLEAIRTFMERKLNGDLSAEESTEKE